MSYTHSDKDGNVYSINYINVNLSQILKNGDFLQSCDTYEEAQHVIDSLIRI